MCVLRHLSLLTIIFSIFSLNIQYDAINLEQFEMETSEINKKVLAENGSSFG